MNLSHYTKSKLTFALFILTLGVATPVFAQTAPKKELSETVNESLPKLKELTDAKKDAEALKLIDQLLAKAAPDTFDVAILSQLKAQYELTSGNYVGTVSALEKAHELGQKYDFFDKKALVEQLYLLTQLNYQLAGEEKKPELQQKYFDKAYASVTQWLKTTPKPTADGYIFASSILFSQATLTDKTDLVKMRKAREEATNGLYYQLEPKEQIYQLMLSASQQLNDNLAASEILELLLIRQPTNSNYWQQLLGTYQTLGAEAKNEKDAFKYNLRAILTLERAQAKGLFKTPKDNLNLVGMYYNLQQYSSVSKLLEAGLSAGSIENNRRNWEMLSAAYQQVGSDDQAIAALTRATKAFPKEGQLNANIANIHYAAGRVSEANKELIEAVTKGNVDKPGATYIFLAYTAFELQEFEQADKWATIAGNQADAKKEDLNRLTKAIKNALLDREIIKNTKI